MNNTPRAALNNAGGRRLHMCGRRGQVIWLGGHFQKAACSTEGRTFQWKLKQVLVQVSLSTNVYCDELENSSVLKIFLNSSAGH